MRVAAATLIDEPAVAAPAAPVDARSGAMVLSLGTIGSGLLAYAFNAVAARQLGPAEYGPIAVLWAATFLVAVVLFRPIEQTLSRGLAERLAAGIDARPVTRSVAALCAGATLVAVAACIAAWQPLTDRLFGGRPAITAMLVVGVVGYGASYFVRGLVGGRRWYAGYGMVLLADGLVRLVLVLPLFFVTSPVIAAVAVAVAAIAGAVAPLLAPGWRHRRRLDGAAGPPFDIREASRFAMPVTVLAAADQVLLSGGPLLVMVAGGRGADAAAGIVFAATMLVRAPAYLFQGMAAALLPNLTTMVVERDEVRFRRAVMRTVLLLAGFSAAMALAALAAGPAGMHLLYGSGFEATSIDLALLAAGAGGYLVASTLTQAALARGEAFSVSLIWAASAALFVVLELSLAGAALHRVAIAFSIAAFVNAAACFAVTLRRAAPVDDLARAELSLSPAPALRTVERELSL